jgi:hypothetical protein
VVEISVCRPELEKEGLPELEKEEMRVHVICSWVVDFLADHHEFLNMQCGFRCCRLRPWDFQDVDSCW